MNKALLASAIVAGLLSGKAAMANEAAPAAGKDKHHEKCHCKSKAEIEKCEKEHKDGKNSCKGEKNSCKNSCKGHDAAAKPEEKKEEKK